MRRLVAIGAAVLAVVGVATPAQAAGVSSRAVCPSAPVGYAQCLSRVVTVNGNVLSAFSPNALPVGYGPAQYHTGYALPLKTPRIPGTVTWKHVTVSIVDAYDDATIYADLTKYSQAFGLPVLPKCTATVLYSCFQKVNQAAPVGSAVANGWDLEIALDVETVHAICENCKILLVESKDSGLSNLATATNYAAAHASIVSNSYGAYGADGGSGSPMVDAAYNHPNKAIVVSAGDSGYGVSFPASLNTVVSVGGTALTLNTNNTYASEAVWGHDGHGTGSGCSSAQEEAAGFGFSSPVIARTFQTSVPGWSNTGCGSFRGDNDVSANADPNTGSAVYAASTSWIQVGGTSLAAPLIAAVYGLAANAGTATYPASILYAHPGSTQFHDVTTGSDNQSNWPFAPSGSTSDTAAIGFDLPTGLGTPRGIGGF
jgi:subtilase family serine protease